MSVFVTVTLTAPAAWAGVFAVMVVELTTTTFVAAEPPKVTVAPAWKPVPLMVTGVPPRYGPLFGVTDVTVTAGGAAVTVTFGGPRIASSRRAVVTVTLSVSVPAAPAVKVMLLPCRVPPVIVPLVMVQAYVAPTPALATEAALPVEPATTLRRSGDRGVRDRVDGDGRRRRRRAAAAARRDDRPCSHRRPRPRTAWAVAPPIGLPLRYH